MNILHGSPVYRADAGAVSPDPSHPEIRWCCPRNLNFGRFGLIAPANVKLPGTPFRGSINVAIRTAGLRFLPSPDYLFQLNAVDDLRPRGVECLHLWSQKTGTRTGSSCCRGR